MAKKPSHIPIFPDAYLRDTMHLTTEEHGAYFMLMMAAWGSDDCSLPYDNRRLAALVKMPLAKWNKISDTILEFWTIKDGRITQKRLLKEWAYVKEKSMKAKASVSSRWGREGAYERNTDVIHLGVGGGGGAGVPFTYQEEDIYKGDEFFDETRIPSARGTH